MVSVIAVSEGSCCEGCGSRGEEGMVPDMVPASAPVSVARSVSIVSFIAGAGEMPFA